MRFVSPDRRRAVAAEPFDEPASGLRVLHIEDDLDMQLLVRTMLADHGRLEIASIDGVPTRAAARLALDACRYDAVIVDLDLPDAQGTDAVEVLAAHDADAAVVVLSATADHDAAVVSVRHGALEVLSKSALTIETLGDALELALTRASMRHDLRVEAVTDELTGLLNHVGLDRALVRAMDAPDAVVGLVLVDLDGFRGVNSRHGYLLGDEVLRATADRLREDLREGDAVARIGADRFAVVVASEDASWIRHFEARLFTDFVNRPISIGLAAVTATVGGAILRRGTLAIEALDAADEVIRSRRRRRELENARGTSRAVR